MNTIGRKLAGVGLGALFVIGLGGAGLAYAQTADEGGTTTTAPSAEAPASPARPSDPADPNCEEKLGGRRGADPGSV